MFIIINFLIRKKKLKHLAANELQGFKADAKITFSMWRVYF